MHLTAVTASLVDLDDVGMTKPGHRLGLPEEPPLRLRAPPSPLQDLEGDDPLKARIMGGVDRPHTADAELTLKLKTPHAGGRRERAEETRRDQTAHALPRLQGVDGLRHRPVGARMARLPPRREVVVRLADHVEMHCRRITPTGDLPRAPRIDHRALIFFFSAARVAP